MPRSAHAPRRRGTGPQGDPVHRVPAPGHGPHQAVQPRVPALAAEVRQVPCAAPRAPRCPHGPAPRAPDPPRARCRPPAPRCATVPPRWASAPRHRSARVTPAVPHPASKPPVSPACAQRPARRGGPLRLPRPVLRRRRPWQRWNPRRPAPAAGRAAPARPATSRRNSDRTGSGNAPSSTAPEICAVLHTRKASAASAAPRKVTDSGSWSCNARRKRPSRVITSMRMAAV